jgi:hypothetical protein
MSESGDEIRDEVHRRFRVWGWQAAPARRYALLVAGYFRTRGPFGVEGEDKYLALPHGAGLRLVEWVEASVDRPLSPSGRADAAGVVAAVEEGVRRRVSRDAIYGHDRFAAVGCLRLALADPLRAAARLILLPGAVPADEPWLLDSPPQYPAVQAVMECLCPARWNHEAVGWRPSPEAVAWARRVYEEQAFGDLPILADMLEDGGCPDRPLLDHCRSGGDHFRGWSGGDHFRGCAAVDRILGWGRI